MSITQPSSPLKKSQRRFPTLHAHWRWNMMLGLNGLIVLILGITTLIIFLGQRQSIIRLHESSARQTSAAVQQSMDDMWLTLTTAAQKSLTKTDLELMLARTPALQTLSTVYQDGIVVDRVPTSDTEAPNWRESPAWKAAIEGKSFIEFTYDEKMPLLLAAIPTQSGALIAEISPQLLWQAVISPAVGDDGRVYLVDENGTLVASDPDLWREQAPSDLEVLQAARDGSPHVMIYQGLGGGWVTGRAEDVPTSAAWTSGWAGAAPNISIYVITETPVSEFTPAIVRTVALWIASLLLSLLIGEWLIRLMLRPVLSPIEIIQQAARAVGEGNYRSIIRLPADTEREMVELGQSLNSVISRLQDGQKQLDAFTNEMEEIVDLRARELSRKAQRLEVAAEVSSKIASILDPRALVTEVEDLIRAQFVVYHVEVLLLDPQSSVLAPGRNTRVSKPAITVQEHATSVIAWVARNAKTLYVPDVNEEPRYQRDPHLPASQSELAIPLRFGGRVVGVLNLESEHRQSFSKDDIAVLESLGNEIAIAIHNAQIFDALETANRDLAQATLQAKQASVLKSRFLLNASHKLRTPLNVIIGYSETILSGMYGEIPEKVIDRQSRILENGRHLQALIEDMLDLSSIETGHMELSLEWVNLPPLLEEVMNATRALHQTGYADHDLTLRLSMPTALPYIWADLNRLRYILISLMSNAVKFTTEGEVVMSAEKHDNTVEIYVKDTGPGIREDELMVLFEPFQHQRGSTADEGKGTGLGLPVSRLLALMHGGDLTVDSVLHQGSTFTVMLPCRPEGAPPPPEIGKTFMNHSE